MIDMPSPVPGVGRVRDIAMSPDGRSAYVAGSHIDGHSDVMAWSVVVVDTAANAVVGTITDPPDLVPAGVRISADSALLYIADQHCAVIHVIELDRAHPRRSRAVARFFLSGTSPTQHASVTAFEISPDGSRLYALVGESGANPAVMIVDTHVGAPVAVISGADSMALHAAGNHIYICADDRRGHAAGGVTIVDANSGRLLGFRDFDNTTAFIGQPILASSVSRLYLDIDDLDGHLEVMDSTTFDIIGRVRIDAAADEMLRSIPKAAALSPDGRLLYVANQGVRMCAETASEVGWVSVVDTATNTVVDNIALPYCADGDGGNPTFVALGPTGERLIVVNEYATASVVDTASRSVVDTVIFGGPDDQPRVIAVSPLRDRLYVGTGADGGLTAIPL